MHLSTMIGCFCQCFFKRNCAMGNTICRDKVIFIIDGTDVCQTANQTQRFINNLFYNSSAFIQQYAESVSSYQQYSYAHQVGKLRGLCFIRCTRSAMRHYKSSECFLVAFKCTIILDAFFKKRWIHLATATGYKYRI